MSRDWTISAENLNSVARLISAAKQQITRPAENRFPAGNSELEREDCLRLQQSVSSDERQLTLVAGDHHTACDVAVRSFRTNLVYRSRQHVTTASDGRNIAPR